MKINLLVLFGGRSVEHEVSVISGVQAMASLSREKYEVIPLYITKQNLFYTGDALFDIENYKDTDALIAKCQRVIPVKRADETVIEHYPAKKLGNNTVAKIDAGAPSRSRHECGGRRASGLFADSWSALRRVRRYFERGRHG